MRQIAIIIFLGFTLNCCSQAPVEVFEISKQTGDIVNRIQNINELMGSAVYNSGIRPVQYDNFEELRKKATKTELINLTNHPNGVVRCYAFWALSYDSSIDLLPIVIQHIADTAFVNTQFGCSGSSEQVGDFFIKIVTPEYIDLNSNKLKNFQELDSILIYTSNTLYATERAIDDAKLTDRFYNRLKELVLQGKSQSGIVKLAKFRKEQDIPLILNNQSRFKPGDGNYFTYLAISEFPHPVFFPFLSKKLNETLDKNHYSGEWRALYGAIASYQNDEAVKLLSVPFTKVKYDDIRSYHLDFVYTAIQVFYSPLYDNLLWEIWENEKTISAEALKLLYERDRERSYKLIQKTLENANDFRIQDYVLVYDVDQYGEEIPVNLLDRMLDTVISHDKTLAIQLINQRLMDMNVHQFPTIADKAAGLKDNSFSISLLARMEKEHNPHIYLKAAEVLIGFKDKNINQKLLKLPQKNSSLKTDWGGKDFAKLLKDNNIR
jgi:mRNA-degrading endonuclease RelE of RelBE toxin-antitoxin system